MNISDCCFSFLLIENIFLRLDFIRPICLPELAENDLFDPDEVLYVTGWGKTETNKLKIHNYLI